MRHGDAQFCASILPYVTAPCLGNEAGEVESLSIRYREPKHPTGVSFASHPMHPACLNPMPYLTPALHS